MNLCSDELGEEALMIGSAATVDSLKKKGFEVLPTVVDDSTLLDLTKALEELPVTDAVRLKGKKPFALET